MEGTSARNLYLAPIEGWWSYAQIMNYGASQSKGDFLLLLDNDCYLDPDFLANIIIRPNTIQGYLLTYHDDVAQHLGIDLLTNIPTNRGPNLRLKFLQLPAEEYLPAISFSCALIPFAVWDKLKGLDEEFCWAFEDTDFCFRAWEDGVATVFNTSPKAEHEGGATMPIVRVAFPMGGHAINSGKFYKKWTEERRNNLVKVIDAARSKNEAQDSRANQRA
jgi:GT2 family glycosyltransferase